MNQIQAILELGKDGYGVRFDDIPHVIAFGQTIEEAKKEAKEALEGYIIALNMCNQQIPNILKNKYELSFRYDVDSLQENQADVHKFTAEFMQFSLV
jgi:predicted RNase H-like HicB family nuclease